MNDSSVFLILEQPYADAIAWVCQQIDRAGLRAVRTFDLQDARQAHAPCLCPRHGVEQCDCQMVVLLIYEDKHEPISLVAQGHDGYTWFSLVDTAQQHADPRLERFVRRAVMSPIGLFLNQAG